MDGKPSDEERKDEEGKGPESSAASNKNNKSDNERGTNSGTPPPVKGERDDGRNVGGAEGVSFSIKKRATSWRRSFTKKASSMFSRTQPSTNLRNDKAAGKQGGGLLKKKARDTILSVLTKKQTQERQTVPERGERPVSWGPEPEVDPVSKASRPYSVVVKSSTAYSPDKDDIQASAPLGELELVSVKTHPVYKVRAKVIDEEKVHSNDPGSAWKTYRGEERVRMGEKEGSPSRRLLSPISVDRAALDRIAPPGAEIQQEGEAIIVATALDGNTTSPAYTSITAVKPRDPQSPKKEVNLSFQVPGQPQPVTGNSDPTSPIWASTVNVCVPFQVMGGTKARALPYQQAPPPKRPHPRETERNKDGSPGYAETDSPTVVHETIVTSSRDVEVKMPHTISASSIGESGPRSPITSTPIKARPGNTNLNPSGASPHKYPSTQRFNLQGIGTKSGSEEKLIEPTMQSSDVFTSDLSPVKKQAEHPVEKPKKTGSISELTFTIDDETPANKVADQVDGGGAKRLQVNPEGNTKVQLAVRGVTAAKPRSNSASAAEKTRKISTKENDESKKIKPHKDSLMITRGKIGDNSKENASTLPGTGRKLSNSTEVLGLRRKSLPAAADKMPANNVKKDKNSGDSPKPSRRFGTARDIIKSRSSTANSTTAPSPGSSRKQRPQSDPLPGEKVQPAKKQSSSVFSKFSSGKSKSAEIEALKVQLRQVEEEKETLKEKLLNLESQLAIIPVLEKEKLVLERQMNEVVQEREKIKSDLKVSNESLEKLESNIKQLTSEQQLHLEEIEKGQVEMDTILDEKLALEKVKISLNNDNRHLCQQVDSHLQNLRKITKEKDELMSKQCKLKIRLKELLSELGNLRQSVLDLKAANIVLRTEVLGNGSEVRDTLTCCVTGLRTLSLEEEKRNSTRANISATSQTENVIVNNTETQTELENETLSDIAGITNEEYDDLLEELEDNKEEIQALQETLKKVEKENTELVEKRDNAKLELEKQRTEQPKIAVIVNGEEGTKERFQLVDNLTCAECEKLREALESLQTVFCMQQDKMEQLSEENENLDMERKDLQQESKYLKHVLSYRQDVQDAQTVFQKNKAKEVEQLESNLDDAEHKVRGLEDEVYRLHQEKQSLLMSILNLNVENGGEEDGEENAEKRDYAIPGMPEMCDEVDAVSSPDVPGSRYPVMLQTSIIPVKTEPEGSELNDESVSESNSDSEHESKSSRRLKEQIKKLQDENDNLKSSLNESVRTNENLPRNAEDTRVTCQHVDSHSENFEDKNISYEDRVNVEKNSWNARVKDVEEENKNLKELLSRVEDEKLALIRCLDMNSTTSQVSSPHTSTAASPTPTSTTEDEDREVCKDASYIQSIVGKLRRLSMTSASEGESEIDKSGMSGGEELEPGKRPAPDGGPPSSEKRPRDGNELARIVASLETDLGKLKKHMYKKDTDSGPARRGTVKGPKGQILRRHSTVHEINFAKTNLERVYREKRHLKDEVDSLRRCLSTSQHTRRRFSVVETHHATIKTFDGLLQKSDLELRESNAKIARLELMNADAEEKLKEAESHEEDLHKAVIISNNIATEERERSERLEEEKSALLALVQQLTLSRMGGSIGEESGDENKGFRRDGEEYGSSQHSVGSESDPDTPRQEELADEEWTKPAARDRNGNIISRQVSTLSTMSAESIPSRDNDDGLQSRHSSFADVSGFESDESIDSKEDKQDNETHGDEHGSSDHGEQDYSTDNAST